MILTVYLSDGEQAVTEVPITPETTCRDVVEFCKEPGESGCHLAEVWRGNGKSWLKGATAACFFSTNTGADLWLGELTCCHGPLHCQSRFPHRPSDLLLSQSCWLISIFLLRGHSLVENNIPDRGCVNPCYTHTHPPGWCLILWPSAPRMSLSLFPSVFLFEWRY